MGRRLRVPERYEHWDIAKVGRVEAASLAISVVTVAETRAGHVQRGWGSRQTAQAERILSAPGA